MNGSAPHIPSDLILVIGDVALWRQKGRELPADPSLCFAAYEEVDADLLERCNPSVVVSPLVAQDFDAFNLALRLSELGFAGRYRVMCPKLPRPQLIRKELIDHAPGLDCDLFQMSNLMPLQVV